MAKHRITQRCAQASKSHFNEIAALIRPVALLKTQLARPEKMHMDVSGLAMGKILEVMVFDIRQRMTHIPLAGVQFSRIINRRSTSNYATTAANIVKRQNES